ncbi:competence/damage-inducible protein A [Legionella hackeliae]|uniref:Competence-damage inducible protein n=1 Tax=Legionella hackeliae TaxID=449 RepID=A0A0A8UQD7_LEGHA|nr:competence/damage-inducible protein A [Legionella hackeliae]KTD10220.1 competence damage inducible protein CinA [Legionella hackeliae]CEK09716.1 competence-damage inducible protein [Legionella hackeliae]STX49625.1 Competence damage inducible protein CinA [Legionella hackeliae]
MTIALLATGDEIIHGDTLNTNSHYIAHALSSEGLPLGLQMACSDKEHEIHECFKFLTKHHDVIIAIGGLGPTSDDRTRFALAHFLKTKLIEFPDASEHIENRLRIFGRQLNAGNRQQALFPMGATLLPNPNGTALGCSYQWQNKLYILLPGPPRECLPMFNDYVFPLLQTRQHSNKCILKWRLFGVAEGLIAEKLDKILADFDCQTGYRLETPYVEFKVRCKAEIVAQIKERIDSVVAPYLISTIDKKASEQFCEQILQLKTPISIVDEVTGGLLQTLIQRPENYDLLQFNNCNSHTSIRFHLRGLEEYWHQRPISGKTQVYIDYSNSTQQGTETHELAHRSALVVHLAAEWLCFRLSHLINQLH